MFFVVVVVVVVVVFILQNPVHLVSALKVGDILIIGEERREEKRRNKERREFRETDGWEKRREEKRREEKRRFPVPLLPSVKTLHSVPWLSSVPHLDLRQTTQRILIVQIQTPRPSKMKHHEWTCKGKNATILCTCKHQFTGDGECYSGKVGAGSDVFRAWPILRTKGWDNPCEAVNIRLIGSRVSSFMAVR